MTLRLFLKDGPVSVYCKKNYLLLNIFNTTIQITWLLRINHRMYYHRLLQSIHYDIPI